MSAKNLLTRSFLFNLFTLARFSHAKKYLFKTIFKKRDPYYTFVLSKDKERSLCIWAIKQIKHRKQHIVDDLYFWELNQEKWVGNLHHIHGLYEYLEGSFEKIYNCNCRNKVILDIGGYIGDSARFFLKYGARKVIIYEPAQKNLQCMKYNLKGYDVEIVPKGIAAVDGEFSIPSNYPEGHIGFGFSEGRYKSTVQGECFSTILSKVKADIAKVDCEGGEKHLLQVKDEHLKQIPYWMIELHDAHIGQQLEQKFLDAGFKTRATPVPEGHFNVAHFYL